MLIDYKITKQCSDIYRLFFCCFVKMPVYSVVQIKDSVVKVNEVRYQNPANLCMLTIPLNVISINFNMKTGDVLVMRPPARQYAILLYACGPLNLAAFQQHYSCSEYGKPNVMVVNLCDVLSLTLAFKAEGVSQIGKVSDCCLPIMRGCNFHTIHTASAGVIRFEDVNVCAFMSWSNEAMLEGKVFYHNVSVVQHQFASFCIEYSGRDKVYYAVYNNQKYHIAIVPRTNALVEAVYGVYTKFREIDRQLYQIDFGRLHPCMHQENGLVGLHPTHHLSKIRMLLGKHENKKPSKMYALPPSVTLALPLSGVAAPDSIVYCGSQTVVPVGYDIQIPASLEPAKIATTSPLPSYSFKCASSKPLYVDQDGVVRTAE